MKTIKNTLWIALILTTLIFTQGCIINDVNAVKGDGNVIAKNYSIEKFDKLDLGGNFNVKLVKGDKENLVIEADENLLQYINIKNQEKTLKIYSDRNVLLRPTKLTIEITYVDLEKISSGGACKISADTTITSGSFTINISGAASIDLDIESEEVFTTISGAADFNLSGKTTSHKATLSGASNLNAVDLVTENTRIRLSGAGAAKVNATEMLDAKISGVGSIQYTGNPKVKDTSISGIGSIKSKN